MPPGGRKSRDPRHLRRTATICGSAFRSVAHATDENERSPVAPSNTKLGKQRWQNLIRKKRAFCPKKTHSFVATRRRPPLEKPTSEVCSNGRWPGNVCQATCRRIAGKCNEVATTWQRRGNDVETKWKQSVNEVQTKCQRSVNEVSTKCQRSVNEVCRSVWTCNGV